MQVRLTKPTVDVHTLAMSSLSVSEPNLLHVMDMTRYSTLHKLIRVTALVLKFINLCRRSCSSTQKELASADLTMAERLWVKSIQAVSFALEIQAL